MRRIAPSLALLALFGILVALWLTAACEDSEVADIPPPGTSADDDGGNGGGWQCDIDGDNLEAVPFWANLYDPTGEDSSVTIDEVLGSAELLADGERFEIRGAFALPQIAAGKVEAVIGCQAGAAYPKCSWSFSENSGEFKLRVQVADCDGLSQPTNITINVWDSAREKSWQMAIVHLGEPAGDDDDDDDDASPTDNWPCDIPGDGMADVPYLPNCFDPWNNGNEVAVDAVLGTAPEMAEGERFELRGAFQLPSVPQGKLELVIGCPAGSAYQKCSWPFSESEGDFRLRLQVADCDPLTDTTGITVNVWDESYNQITPVCRITLGTSTDDDDNDNNDDNDNDNDDNNDTTGAKGAVRVTTEKLNRWLKQISSAFIRTIRSRD